MAKTIHATCVYCNTIDDLTKDHVIPQCLFPDGIPIDAPKVWACETCNGVIKSRLDTYLRDFLATDMHTSRSPIVQQMIPKFHRAVKRNQSDLAQDILQNSQKVELRTPGGLYFGQAYTIPTATDKTLEIMTMYVRGLYAYYHHKPLPQGMEFDFVRADISNEVNDMIQTLNRGGGSYGKIGNGDVFECAFGHAGDVPEAGIWILNFMRRALFVVIVIPKHLSQQSVENFPIDT